MPKIQHEGMHLARLHPAQGNPREVAFAARWKSENSRPTARHQLLDYLLMDDASERDAIVAATVIQWIGSPAGFSFLREALVDCGYAIVATRDGSHA